MIETIMENLYLKTIETITVLLKNDGNRVVFIILVYDNDFDWLSIFTSMPTSLLYFQL